MLSAAVMIGALRVKVTWQTQIYKFVKSCEKFWMP